MDTTKFRLCKLTEEHFDAALKLCYQVHGDNFYTWDELKEEVRRGTIGDLSTSFIVYEIATGKMVGLRLTSTHGQWDREDSCSPEKWDVDPEKVCYFHTAAVDPDYRGAGIGSCMLRTSIKIAQKMGAEAGLAHVWLQSPNNSAFNYFSRNGGRFIKEWPEKFIGYHTKERPCPRCGPTCHCDAAEMIIYFGEQD